MLSLDWLNLLPKKIQGLKHKLMSVLDIVKYGDPRLRKEVRKVEDFSILPDIINKMYDSMYEADGIGLAANQIGYDIDLFIIDLTDTEEISDTFEFVNSKIVEKHGEAVFSEGCLSLPGIEFDIKRPEYVTVQYQKPNGTSHKQEFSGLFARAIQHEIDHLAGKLIIDRVSSIEKLRYRTQLKDTKKLAAFKYAELLRENSSVHV